MLIQYAEAYMCGRLSHSVLSVFLCTALKHATTLGIYKFYLANSIAFKADLYHSEIILRPLVLLNYRWLHQITSVSDQFISPWIQKKGSKLQFISYKNRHTHYTELCDPWHTAFCITFMDGQIVTHGRGR